MKLICRRCGRKIRTIRYPFGRCYTCWERDRVRLSMGIRGANLRRAIQGERKVKA